jgi:hypothetical protein
MDDDRLITCSISMERWKSASPCLGTCKVVIGILNKKAMDLEFIKLPVKPLCSLILSLSNVFAALQWVISTTMLSTSSMSTSLFALISSEPTPLLLRISQGRHGHRRYFQLIAANKQQTRRSSPSMVRRRWRLGQDGHRTEDHERIY